MKKMKILTALLLSAMAASSMAAQVSVSKLRINLENGQTADFLNLHNESETDKESFEITLQKWSQKNNLGEAFGSGPEEVLVETETVLASPKTVVILPKQDKLIRIIVNDVDEAKKDYSYRLILNQLPNKEIGQQKNTVNLLFKISLPIFVYSDAIKTFEKMKVEHSVVKENGKNYLLLTNKDNQHVQIQDVTWGKFQKSVNQYILPNVTNKIELPDNVQIDAKNPLNIGSDKGTLKIEK